MHFTDNWKGKQKVKALAIHDVRSFFTRQFRAKWFVKDCNIDIAIVCNACFDELSSWLHFGKESNLEDLYAISYDGRGDSSSTLTYSSHEMSGTSSMPLFQLRVRSTDGFRAHFEMSCSLAGIPVPLTMVLGGATAETGSEFGVDKTHVALLTSSLEALWNRDALLDRQFCKGSVLRHEGRGGSTPEYCSKIISSSKDELYAAQCGLNLHSSIVGLTTSMSKSKVKETRGLISCGDVLYSAVCELSRLPLSPDQDDDANMGKGMDDMDDMEIEISYQCTSCERELSREREKQKYISARQRADQKLALAKEVAAMAEVEVEAEREKEKLEKGNEAQEREKMEEVDEEAPVLSPGAVMLNAYDDLFRNYVNVHMLDYEESLGEDARVACYSDAREKTILNEVFRDLLTNMIRKLERKDPKGNRYSPLSKTFWQSICSKIKNRAWDELRKLLCLPTGRRLSDVSRPFSLSSPGVNMTIVLQGIARVKELYPG